MPPKGQPQKAALVPSVSREIVTTGPKHISTKVKQSTTKRNEQGEKPTTVRAMVLRNGKYGARGTGEMIAVTRLSGREKLDLLAEDLVAKSQTAVINNFNLERCLRLTEAQFDVYLDDIANLQDADLFEALITVEIKARTRTPAPSRRPPPDPAKNPSYVAGIVGTRIHNAYTLASAWKLFYKTLSDLAKAGLHDESIVSQLTNNESLRTRYLVLYDMVNVLVKMSQDKFSVLATTTSHYARYFKNSQATAKGDPEDAQTVFDHTELREACKSFLDSIILELAFPQGAYPKAILYQILHDAVDESPKEAKRFPQPLWDAIGDLSVALELRTLLELPLLGPAGERIKAHSRQMPEDYEKWIDAQFYSQKASTEIGNFKDIIMPLEKTHTKSVLENMWKTINLNYKSVSGQDIDSLWNLGDSLRRAPEWHAIYADITKDGGYESDENYDGPPRLGPARKKKQLAIKGPDEESDNSMPELQSVSNSSEDEVDSDDSDSEDEFTDSDAEESGYDTDQEDELREMVREAMDTAFAADYFSGGGIPDDLKPQFEDKSNPFLKLLGSLKGRMFNSSAKLKPTTDRTEPRGAKPGPFHIKTPAARATDDVPKPGTLNNQKATVEDAEDEDDDAPHRPKKKKKKPKKKKKKAAPGEPADQDAENIETPPVPPPAAAKAAPAKRAPAKPVASAIASNVPAFMSTTSLESITTVQSGRSYMQSENIETKTKIKSRPDHASLFPIQEKKGGLFSRLMGKKNEPENPEAKHTWFSKLTKKTTGLMHQLLNTAEDHTKGIAPMKWENFLKLMREMGFEYDPSTAGSSVRFDPPNKQDRSITFHKPHPDPTLTPIKLKEYSKKLKSYYGWCEEDFIKSKK